MANSWFCTLLGLLLMLGSTAADAQVAERLSQIRKLYVGALGTDNGAAEMREQMVRQLRKSRDVRVVPDAKEADAVVKGDGRIWVTGHVSLSPHAHSSSQPIYE